MKHVKALLIKFIMITGILLIILRGFYQFNFWSIIVTSLLLTGVSYLLGDLIILPLFENWGATIADFVLVFMGVWVLGSLYPGTIPFPTVAGISSLFIAGGEYFFHQYMAHHVLRKRLSGTGLSVESHRFQSELSSELSESDDLKGDRPKDDL